ncbi:MAG: glycosyl transferase, group 2 family [Firmicutes bacterium]|nr:glycosyl transferase, group 2 family [Bacillota bacterium]
MDVMNENKICFITCVNDEDFYKESVYYIKHLTVPVGFEIELVAIRGASYLTKAYNEAMQSSDAKYKVYLHQDVFIVNKNFIIDIIHIFQRDKKIGMIGIVGADKLPINACWWEAKNRYGNVYDSHKGYMDRDSFNDFSNDSISVQAIDGILIVTQYDIPWREDIFKGWHFYDISQSIEFAKKGYQIVVPKQVEPWCIHDCGITPIGELYEKYRNVFLEEYSEWAF